MARVILQQAPTGLDTFLEEISKYASPEYQLRKKESERADARLELSRNQQEESDLRYRDSVRQQRFQNDLATEQESRQKKAFEMEEKKSYRNMAQESIQNQLAGMSLKDIVDMPVEKYGADIDDPKLSMMIRKLGQSTRDKATSKYNQVLNRIESHNSRYPDNTISEAVGLDVFSDDENYADYISNIYLGKKEGDLTPVELKQLDFFSKTIASADKYLADIREKEASGIEVDDAENLKLQYEASANEARAKLESILGISTEQQGTGTDPYNNQSNFRAPLQPAEPQENVIIGDIFDANEPVDYGILYADQENILDTAEQARQNADDDSNVAIDGDFPADSSAYAQAIVPEDLSEEDKRELGVPSLLSGLGIAQAQPRKTVKESLQEISRKAQEQKPKRKRSLFAIRDFRSDLNKVRKIKQQLQKETAGSKRENLEKQLRKVESSIMKAIDKNREGYRDLFLSRDNVERYKDMYGEDGIGYLLNLGQPTQPQVLAN
jgi:hypothetical protein